MNLDTERVLMTLLAAAAAGIATVCVVFYGSLFLTSRINSKLGLPFESSPNLEEHCQADSLLKQFATQPIPANTNPQEPKSPLKYLSKQLESAHSPAAAFKVICSAHRTFRDLAESGETGILPCRQCGNSSAPAPGENGSRDDTITVGPASSPDCKARPQRDLEWTEPRCVLERIHSVRSRDLATGGFPWFGGRVVMDNAATTGLQGNMYLFKHSRTIRYVGDPDEVTWGSAAARSTTESLSQMARDIQDLQTALFRLDKIVLPRIKEIENSVGRERFLLQALNQWMQAMMIWLGLWAAFIYGYDLIKATYRVKQPAALVDTLAAERPHGDAVAMPASPPTANEVAPRLAFSSELRNVMDQVLTRWQLQGRALADTLTEWIPLIGFIGTVVGMIGAIDAIGAVIQADQGPELYSAMGDVTSQLMLAFFTTFIGLVLSAMLTLLRRYCIGTEHAAVLEAGRQLRA